MTFKNNAINFVKLVGAGNDFILIDNRVYRISSALKLKGLARKICDRKFGAGADGLLVLESSKSADSRMRIFNPDGSEAAMCGNGARCFAYYILSCDKTAGMRDLSLETRAGIVKASVLGSEVKINLPRPKGLKLDIPLKLNGRAIKVNFIDTGVPHTVIFVEGLDRIDVKNLGSQIRNHRYFSPSGTNVNFVEQISPDSLKIRTYERGVEDETLACGTGSAAAALIFAAKNPGSFAQIKVRTAGGEILKVSFCREGSSFRDVWLEGKARLVYRGEYYV
jgi:diaminopimelate epimerase